MIRVARRHVPILTTLALVVATFAAGSVAYPNFASVGVARDLLVDNAFLAVAAVGATFVILSGAIDLSVGSVMAFTGILVGSLIERHAVHPLVAIGASLLAGAAFGLCQGIIIEVFKLPSFLVTLAGMFFARGAAFLVHPQSIGIKHAFVGDVLNDRLSLVIPLGERTVSIPVTVDIALAAIALAAIMLHSTRFGRSGAAKPANTSGYSTFSRALSTGIRLKVWKMKPMWRARKSDKASSGMDCTCRPATVILPRSGMSIQPIRLSRVVLPLPEGPDSTVKAPWWMSRVISLRAGTSTAPRR